MRLGSNGTSTWNAFRANASGTTGELLDFFTEWLASTRANRGDSRQMLCLLSDWAKTACPGASVAEIMTRQVREPKFSDYSKAAAGKKVKVHAAIVTLAKRFSGFIEEELRAIGVQSAIWPLVADNDVKSAAGKVKGMKADVKPAEAQSCPLPPQLQPIVEEILDEGEGGWPGRSGYCPVLPMFFRAMLMLPLRGAQMARLDSGEGDEEAFDGSRLAWIRNPSPLAGYWKRVDDGHGALRGYARRDGDPTSTVTGFLINTSKTGNPYVIPWEHSKLHRLFWELRLWQQEHNPISAPVKPDDYVDDKKTSEERVSSMPDIFPLFRMPATGRNRGLNTPPAHRKSDQAWQEIMAETERRWNDRNPSDCIEIVKRQAKTKQPYGACYNVHGLRVAGLTRLFMAGMPIEVLSKLVAGHRGLAMTMYYLKFRPANVHRILEEAVVRADTAAAQGFMADLGDWTLEQARKRAAYLQEDGMSAAVEMDSALRLLHTDVTIGMCPWAGTRCGDGGSL